MFLRQNKSDCWVYLYSHTNDLAGKTNAPHTHSPDVYIMQASCSPENCHQIQFFETLCLVPNLNVSVHCREEGCIGKYTPRGPRDFPRAGILHPEAREIARGRSPRAISRAEGCKIPTRGKSRGPRWVYFPMHPDSRQCTDILSELAGKY